MCAQNNPERHFKFLDQAPGKKKAGAAAVENFRKYAAAAGIEAVNFPFDGKTVHAYLALPKGLRPAPVVLSIGGLDSYKEYSCERAGVKHIFVKRRRLGVGIGDRTASVLPRRGDDGPHLPVD